MLESRNLHFLPQNPTGSNLLFLQACSRFLTFPSNRVCPSGFRSIMAIVAEYARSNRYSCKKCGKTISGGSLRLGLVSRDSRGFDMTKWHHVDCFPRKSEPIVEAEKIKGFSLLKDLDKEALKKLETGSDKSTDEADEADGSKGKRLKESKVFQVHVRDEAGDIEERDKKQKLSGSVKDAKVEIVFSVSDIKTKYKEAVLSPKWKAFQTIIFLEQDEGLHDSEKIAAFDFDGCLVNTSVKRVGPNAWSLLYKSIPEKLQSLYNNGYKLVIFTNESNIERWKNKRQVAVDSKIGRLSNFIEHIKVPMQVFIACGLGKATGQTEDPFRKPNTGMWRIMERHFNSGIAIDMDQSFYVGDAAGRPSDHSDADIRFAEAVGLKFYLPEEYFGA